MRIGNATVESETARRIDQRNLRTLGPKQRGKSGRGLATTKRRSRRCTNELINIEEGLERSLSFNLQPVERIESLVNIILGPNAVLDPGLRSQFVTFSFDPL